jgi:coenzyme PQQ synthesis protein D (PqqD)
VPHRAGEFPVADKTNVDVKTPMSVGNRRVVREREGSDRYVTRRVGPETIIVPIRSRVGDLECIYTLNEIATRVWDALTVPRSAAQIAHTMAAEYDVPESQLLADITEFVDTLVANGLASETVGAEV